MASRCDIKLSPAANEKQSFTSLRAVRSAAVARPEKVSPKEALRPKTATASATSPSVPRATAFVDPAPFFSDKHSQPPIALNLVHPPAPSPAIAKMKASAALKELESLDYMRKFSTNPYAAKSAKTSLRRVIVRPNTASSTLSNKPQLPSAMIMSYDDASLARAKSAGPVAGRNHAAEKHAIRLWRLMEKRELENFDSAKSRVSRPSSPKSYDPKDGGIYGNNIVIPTLIPPSTTIMVSPLSVKLVADLKNIGVSSETAAIVGAAVASTNLESNRTLSAASMRNKQRPNTAVSQKSFEIYQSSVSSVDPTVSWPKQEAFVSHWGAQHKKKPVGAHSSGFYAKQHHAVFTVNSGQYTIATSNPLATTQTKQPGMQKPPSILHHGEGETNDMDLSGSDFDIADSERISVNGQKHGFRKQAVTSPKTASDDELDPSSTSRKKAVYINETNVTDEQLCIMTDPECSHKELITALSILISLATESEIIASTTLFDRGGVAIILYVMNRVPDDHEVQWRACRLLEIMAEKNPLTLACLYKQNGIMSILGSVRTISKNAAIVQNQSTQHGLQLHVQSPNQTRTKRPWSNSIKSTSSKPLEGGSMNDLASGSMANLDAAPASSSDRLFVPSSPVTKQHNLPTSPSIASPLASSPLPGVSTQFSGDSDFLCKGILQKYYDPRFTTQLEKMDKTTRSEIIRHLLGVCQKVDKLISISSLASLEMDTEFALDQLIAEAEDLVAAQLILLYIIDPHTGELVAADYDPYLDSKEKELIHETQRFKVGNGIAGWVAYTKETANIRDANRHDRFDPDVDTRGMNILAASILAVPIISKEGVLKGVLQAVNKTSVNGAFIAFNHEDEFLLKSVGSLAGVLINNSQIYDRLRLTQEKVEVLLETTRSLGSTLELELLVKRIMESAKDLLMADRCTLFLSDVKAKQLKAHIQGRDTIQEIRIPMNSGIAGFAFTSGESVNIPDAYKDSRFNPEVDKQTGYKTRNMLCMPIRNISGNSIGVTQMINKKGGPFGVEDEKLLSSFSAQAAVAIENSNLFKKTEDMLRETSEVKNYLNMIIQSITNVVITLDKNGHLSHINHPHRMDIDAEAMRRLHFTHFQDWLGDANATLVGDIRRAYRGVLENGSIIAQDYELNLNGKIRNVNYTIVQMTGSSGSMGGASEHGLENVGDSRNRNQISRKRDSENEITTNFGVVIVFEDISSEKRALMTLGRYMSPALAKQVMAEDGGQLGGKRKKVAILFSDIRNFTTISESMEPQMVVEMLNSHFTDAVNAILAEQGILDKYIGDAVMAVFGVPFISPEDSIHACNAALRMKESLHIYNEHVRIPANQAPIKMGIGVNTGIVLSGNIGSVKRMEFSCFGDAVNLGSRVEGMTKMYGVTILITEYTVAEVGNHFLLREVDSVIVKGKSKAVTLYELLGRKDDVLSSEQAKVLEYYELGLKAYRGRFFEQAIECFGLGLGVIRDDGPCQTMIDRCRLFLQEPPPDGWNGVYYADSK